MIVEKSNSLIGGAYLDYNFGNVLTTWLTFSPVTYEPKVADFFSESAKFLNKTGLDNIIAGRGRIRRRATRSDNFLKSFSNIDTDENANRAEILVPNFENNLDSADPQPNTNTAINPTVRFVNSTRALSLIETQRRGIQKKVLDEIYLPAPARYRSIASFLESGEMLSRLGEELEKKLVETNVSKVLRKHTVLAAERTPDDELWKVTLQRVSDGKKFTEYSRILQVAAGADEAYIEGVREQSSGLHVPVRKDGKMPSNRSSARSINENTDSKEVSSAEKSRILKNLPPVASEMFSKVVENEPDTSMVFIHYARRDWMNKAAILQTPKTDINDGERKLQASAKLIGELETSKASKVEAQHEQSNSSTFNPNESPQILLSSEVMYDVHKITKALCNRGSENIQKTTNEQHNSSNTLNENIQSPKTCNVVIIGNGNGAWQTVDLISSEVAPVLKDPRKAVHDFIVDENFFENKTPKCSCSKVHIIVVRRSPTRIGFSTVAEAHAHNYFGFDTNSNLDVSHPSVVHAVAPIAGRGRRMALAAHQQSGLPNLDSPVELFDLFGDNGKTEDEIRYLFDKKADLIISAGGYKARIPELFGPDGEKMIVAKDYDGQTLLSWPSTWDENSAEGDAIDNRQYFLRKPYIRPPIVVTETHGLQPSLIMFGLGSGMQVRDFDIRFGFKLGRGGKHVRAEGVHGYQTDGGLMFDKLFSKSGPHNIY